MFIAQKQIIGKCNAVSLNKIIIIIGKFKRKKKKWGFVFQAGKPVLCTAEFSSWFSGNVIVRRAEINDVSNAIIDGADGIILITETALGNEGVTVVSELSRVITEAEAVTMQKTFFCDLTKEVSLLTIIIIIIILFK